MEELTETRQEKLGWRGRVDVTTYVVVLFWIGQFCILTAQRALWGVVEESTVLIPRICVAIAGMFISFAIAKLLKRQEGWGWGARIGATLLLALIGAFLHSLANFAIFQIAMPDENVSAATIESYAMAGLQWFWAYCAISAMLLAGVYSAELREGERRLAELRSLAHVAQLRALRYQLNPHFMFNTLNSIASLIASGEAVCAEQMVENLSDFLRAALRTDPNEDLPLAHEIELQSLYLMIETVRFADRLKVEIDVPHDLRNILVPSLILQPLVENAIKHGVARSERPTVIEISAKREGADVRLAVCNTVFQHSRAQVAGEGIGLANVERRLLVRYDDDCDFRTGVDSDGRFAVSFLIPSEGAPP